MGTRLFLGTKLRTNARLMRLARGLGIDEPAALGYLVAFLWWVIDNAPDGDVTDLSAKHLALTCDWEGGPSTFFLAFGHAGFIEANADGRLIVFDWNQWASGLYKAHTKRLSGDQWQRLRAAVFARDGNTCQYCGIYCGIQDVALHCDHRVPLSRGGTNTLDNLVTACMQCNLSKHAQRVEEWLS